MEVSLEHSEVDKRADELARLYLLREKVATRHANVRAKLKKVHDDELTAMDERMEKLANAVRNQREDMDARLSMRFEIDEEEPPVGGDPSDALADHVSAEAERAAEAGAGEAPEQETKRSKRKSRKLHEAQA